MAAVVLDGEAVAKALRQRLAARRAASGLVPRMVMVLVGEDPASQSYLGRKAQDCAQVGMRADLLRLHAKISPEALLAEVGFNFPGQTEFVAHACGVAAQDAVMMLAGPTLRTVPLTVHIALAEVPKVLSKELIVRRARIVAAAMQADFGLAAPRLAICALNPHAGENGRMGGEEIEIIAPAVEELRASGIDATGPHPADSLFAPRARETYDVAIAMYHDQGLIPFKSLAAYEGVNYTAGLPAIRTSPDHGTAFDIAGKNQADHSSFLASVYHCIDIIEKRNFYRENRKNPLKKITSVILANAVDEKIEETGETEK